MAKGIARTTNGWAIVDFGLAGKAPIPENIYRDNQYVPDFDDLPLEVAVASDSSQF